MNSSREIQNLIDKLNQVHPKWSDAWEELRIVLEDELDDKRRKPKGKEKDKFILFILVGILLSVSSLVSLTYLILYFIGL